MYFLSTRNLFLDKNQITSSPGGLFTGIAGNIKILHLQGNRIAQITTGAFTGFNNVVDLNLADNKITSIAQNAFIPSGPYNNLTMLQYLSLKGNEIASVSKGRDPAHTFHTFHTFRKKGALTAVCVRMCD